MRKTIRVTISAHDGRRADTYLIDVPSRLDDRGLIWLGMGVAFSNGWCPDDITLTIKQYKRVLFHKEY